MGSNTTLGWLTSSLIAMTFGQSNVIQSWRASATRQVLRFAFVLVLSIATSVISEPARGTAFSIDQSELWWEPAESGWGIQFVQTDSTIFATLHVYGPQSQPAWYVAVSSPVK
jgi:hypothetical protein